MSYEYVRITNFEFEIGNNYKGLNKSNYILIAQLKDNKQLFLNKNNKEVIIAFNTKMYKQTDRTTKQVIEGIQWASANYLSSDVISDYFDLQIDIINAKKWR